MKGGRLVIKIARVCFKSLSPWNYEPKMTAFYHRNPLQQATLTSHIQQNSITPNKDSMAHGENQPWRTDTLKFSIIQ